MSRILSDSFLQPYNSLVPQFGGNGIGEFVFKRTYAREKEDGHKENWVETLSRCVEGAQKIGAGYSTEEAQELFDLLFHLKGSFAGRSLWQLGTSMVEIFGAPSLINCFMLSMDSITSIENLMLLSMNGAGVGYTIERAVIHELPKIKEDIKIEHFNTKDADFIVPDSREGWVRLLHNVLNSFFHTGESFTYSTYVVRGYGEKLARFGGTASGAQVLIQGIEDICKILRAREGKKARSVDILDICNIIGRIVCAGNTRRSAQLAAADPDDLLFMRAKRWGSMSIPAYRSHSNNSIIADSYDELTDEYWKNFDGNSECYGLLNRKLARVTGRLGEYVDDKKVIGTNPCLSGDTPVFTKDKVITIKEWADSKDCHEVWDGNTWVHAHAFKTGRKKILKLKLSGGYELRLTEDHKIGLVDGSAIAAKDSLGESIEWMVPQYSTTKPFNDEMVMIGFVQGDGSYHKATGSFAEVSFGKKDNDVYNYFANNGVQTYLETNTKSSYRINNYGFRNKCDKLLNQTTLVTRTLTNDIISLPKNDLRSFLRGVFSANGCALQPEYKRVQLKATCHKLITQIQTLLASLGIRSAITKNNESEIKWHNGTFISKESYNLSISSYDVLTFRDLIGFIQTYKTDRLNKACKLIENQKRFSRWSIKVIDIEEDGVEDVYDYNMQTTHWASINGFRVANCSEIFLQHGESCNLSEIFLPNISSQKEFNTISKLLYKTQKAITSLRYPFKEAQDVVRKNRRLGQGVTGWLQATEEQLSYLDPGYQNLRKFDKEWSTKLGINESIKLSTVKPSGSLSLLPVVTSGIHPAISTHSIRRIRVGSNDPLVKAAKEAGYNVQYDIGLDGSLDHLKCVVDFPCKFPDSTIVAGQMTAIQQMEWVVKAQTIWSDNAVSVTVYFNKEELPEIKDWLKNNYENKVKSISFLLKQDHGFKLPPLEEITKEQYEKMVSKLKPIQIDGDGIDSSLECEGGACPIR